MAGKSVLSGGPNWELQANVLRGSKELATIEQEEWEEQEEDTLFYPF